MGNNQLALRAGVSLPEVRFLLQEQKNAAARIIREIHRIAHEEAKVESKYRGDYASYQRNNRPRHVAFIDGARGIGKTTLLLKIEDLIHCLGTGQSGDRRNSERRELDRRNHTELKALFCKKNLSNVEAHLDLTQEDVDTLLAQIDINGCVRRTAISLPVIFPDDIEVYGNTMEAIFAQLIHELNKQANNSKTKEILKDLRDKVAQGWYFSRQLGVEALLRDSADFNEFIRRQTDEAANGYRRIEEWRNWVNQFLDNCGSELLVIFIDDTDIRPASTYDILQSLLNHLDHPRIFTVLTGNLRSMQYSLLDHALNHLRPAIVTLGSKRDAIAVEWRNHISHQVAEHLQKVLPWSHRHHLAMTPKDGGMVFTTPSRETNDAPISQCTGSYHGIAHCRTCTEDPGQKQELQERANRQIRLDNLRTAYKNVEATTIDDYQNKTSDYFDVFIDKLLNRERIDFLSFRLRSHRAFLRKRKHRTKEFHLHADNFLALWLIKHGYENLRPRVMRHIVDFMVAMDCGGADIANVNNSGEIDAWRTFPLRRRVADALFYNPANVELSSLFRDEDKRFIHWLGRQKLSSKWQGLRHVEINEQTIHERTYEFDYLTLRLDLGLAYPVRESDEVVFPQGLLPTPSGFNNYPQEPLVIFSRKDFIAHMDERHGVASVLNHPIIPANCLYFQDLCDLPDLAWGQDMEIKNTKGAREERFSLIIRDKWNTFFHFTDSKSDPRHTKMVAEYMVRVVLQCLESTYLCPEQSNTNQKAAFTRGYSLLRWECNNNVERDGHDTTTKITNGWIAKKPSEKQIRYQVDKYYRGIVNDVRCAYHALRIYDRGTSKNMHKIYHAQGLPNKNGNAVILNCTDKYYVVGYDDIYKRLLTQPWDGAFTWDAVNEARLENAIRIFKDISVQEPSSSGNLITYLAGELLLKPESEESCTVIQTFWSQLRSGALGPQQAQALGEELSKKLNNDLTQINTELKNIPPALKISISARKDHYKARSTRTILLFIYAILPTMPALIHISLMAIARTSQLPPPSAADTEPYHQLPNGAELTFCLSDNAYEQMKEEVEKWCKLLQWFYKFSLLFIYNYMKNIDLLDALFTGMGEGGSDEFPCPRKNEGANPSAIESCPRSTLAPNCIAKQFRTVDGQQMPPCYLEGGIESDTLPRFAEMPDFSRTALEGLNNDHHNIKIRGLIPEIFRKIKDTKIYLDTVTEDINNLPKVVPTSSTGSNASSTS